MPSHGPKVQIPMPRRGVFPNLNPREIGAEGLVDAENWIVRAGRFQTRDGIKVYGSVDPVFFNFLSLNQSNVETDLTGFSALGGATIARLLSVSAWEGDYVLRVTGMDGVGKGVKVWETGPPAFATLPGPGRYVFAAWMRTEAPVTVDTPVQMQIHECTAAGVSTAMGVGSLILTPDWPAKTWVRIGAWLTMATGTYGYGAFVCPSWAAGQLSSFQLDGMILANVPTGSEIPDWFPGGSSEPYAGDVDQRPLGYYQYHRSDGSQILENELVLGTDTGWWHYHHGSEKWRDITDPLSPLAGGYTSHVIFRGFDYGGITWLIGCNGVDEMKAWNGITDTYEQYADAALSVPLPVAIAISHDRVLALGNFKAGFGGYQPAAVFYGPYQGDPASTGDAWNSADVIRLADTPGAGVAMLEMGRMMTIVYKTDAIYALIGQSGLYPFRAELRAAGITGPASSAAVVAISDTAHVFLARNGGVYIFDGADPRALGEHIQEYIRTHISYEYIGASWLAYDKFWDELWIFFPDAALSVTAESAAVSRALVVNLNSENYASWPLSWHYDEVGGNPPKFFTAGWAGLTENQVTFEERVEPARDWPPFGAWRDLERALILGESGGQSYSLNAKKDGDDGVAILAFAETGLIQVDEQDRMVTVNEIDHICQSPRLPGSPQLLNIQLRTSDYGEKGKLSTAKVITVTAGGPFVTQHRVTARTFAQRLSASVLRKIYYDGGQVVVAKRGRR